MLLTEPGKLLSEAEGKTLQGYCFFPHLALRRDSTHSSQFGKDRRDVSHALLVSDRVEVQRWITCPTLTQQRGRASEHLIELGQPYTTPEI